jgi:hypothetical protein
MTMAVNNGYSSLAFSPTLHPLSRAFKKAQQERSEWPGQYNRQSRRYQHTGEGTKMNGWADRCKKETA